MASTVTIDKVYFETLLRRYAHFQFLSLLYRESVTTVNCALINSRAEFVGLICKGRLAAQKEAYSSL